MSSAQRLIRPGAGSYTPAEYQNPMLGGAEYFRAQQESDMVRAGIPEYSISVRRGDLTESTSSVAPPKPLAVGLIGSDLFGPESLSTSTTRGMSYDLRGEAVSVAHATRDVTPPIGGSIPARSGRIVEKPMASTVRATSSVNKSMYKSSPFGIGGHSGLATPTLAAQQTQVDPMVGIITGTPLASSAPVVAPKVANKKPYMHPIMRGGRNIVNSVSSMFRSVGIGKKAKH